MSQNYASEQYDPRYRVLDIEATGIDSAAEFMEPIEAPSNYKDPAKIAAYIAEAQQAALGKCALDPDLARVVAVGIADPETGKVGVITADSEAQERTMLAEVWRQVQGQTSIVGYNILGYDLPVLLRRSLYLGVPAPAIQIDKYRHPSVIDLMQLLSFNGAIKFRGLKFYAKRFGIPLDDAISGADVPALIAAGKWAEVCAHVRSDVEVTLALARRMGVLRGVAAEQVA
ncbi:MAG: hypothetical protein GEV06_19665 [Luteitalea sp.]|nr:hypothetical protein [Luteitalea sp.]